MLYLQSRFFDCLRDVPEHARGSVGLFVDIFEQMDSLKTLKSNLMIRENIGHRKTTHFNRHGNRTVFL